MIRTSVKGHFVPILAFVALWVFAPGSADAQATLGFPAPADAVLLDPAESVREVVASRLANDVAAIQAYRPGYGFWRHVFSIPDGSIAFGSAEDGRLLAVFPNGGDWGRDGRWEEPALASFVSNQRLPSRATDRRDEVARLLEPVTGPVVHNATRGTFVLPNVRRYGSFLSEWGEIYERFGVPAEIGLAQAMIESGFHPTIRSEARAIGLCQWLEGNWNEIKRHAAPVVVEAHNQTTQAAYCAAYLTVLASKYGSFIPALSEHHAGGANVGRAVINGGRLGGTDVREQYLIGAAFARDLREISTDRYREVVRTYGPRSFLYTEMVFANAEEIVRFRESIPQDPIYAMRATRALPIAEVVRRSGVSLDEVQRYNPALLRQVPAGANLYLPVQVDDFGRDVAFWRRPPTPEYSAVLDDFLRIGAPIENWDAPDFEGVLRAFESRFRDTGTEEGSVMATMLSFVVRETYTSGRANLLADFRTSDRILRLFEEGVLERENMRASATIAR